MKHSQKKITNWLILASCLFLCCCQSEKTEWNNNIDNAIRNPIKENNDLLMNALAENKAAQLKELFSDTLAKQTSDDFETGVSKMHELISTNAYTVLDEYYVKNNSTGFRDTIYKNVPGGPAYRINFEVMTKESYVSLLLHRDDETQLLVTIIYGKYESGWKVDVLRIGRYSFNTKTALDLYNQARTLFESGDLIDAVNLASMIKPTLTPADQFFHYEQESVIKEFVKKTIADAGQTFRFPLPVTSIKTAPTIYNIQPMPMPEGILPVVTYLTKINLADTASLIIENDALQKIIGTLFPGIEKNNRYVLFQAYPEKSGKQKTGEPIEFVMHCLVQ